jgi:NADPH:quinone reductase-like Zn-dependent oxidoreductase
LKAIIYRDNGGPDVLRLVDRGLPVPGPGEVRVRVAVSGVNPTDSQARSGATSPMRFPEVTPHLDGAGTIDAVGEGVDPSRVGQRVWLFMATAGRPTGTAAEIREIAPDGIDIVAEVALGANLALDLAVLRTRGTIATYANEGGRPVELDVLRNMVLNTRLQFLVLYTAGSEVRAAAAEDVAARGQRRCPAGRRGPRPATGPLPARPYRRGTPGGGERRGRQGPGGRHRVTLDRPAKDRYGRCPAAPVAAGIGPFHEIKGIGLPAKPAPRLGRR